MHIWLLRSDHFSTITAILKICFWTWPLNFQRSLPILHALVFHFEIRGATGSSHSSCLFDDFCPFKEDLQIIFPISLRYSTIDVVRSDLLALETRYHAAFQVCFSV